MASLLGKAAGDALVPGSGFGKKFFDPIGLKNKPKAPKKSQQELAAEKRNRSLLDDEIEESERRFKLLTNRKLGAVSLLTGAPRNPTEAAGGGNRSSGLGVGAGSSLSGGRGAGSAVRSPLGGPGRRN